MGQLPSLNSIVDQNVVMWRITISVQLSISMKLPQTFSLDSMFPIFSTYVPSLKARGTVPGVTKGEGKKVRYAEKEGKKYHQAVLFAFSRDLAH